MKSIFLNNYSTYKFLLEGKEEGIQFRKDFHLDEEDEKDGKVVIYIPNTRVGLGGAFYMGAFEPSVLKLGKEGFHKKYKFICHINLKHNLFSEVEITDRLYCK